MGCGGSKAAQEKPQKVEQEQPAPVVAETEVENNEVVEEQPIVEETAEKEIEKKKFLFNAPKGSDVHKKVQEAGEQAAVEETEEAAEGAVEEAAEAVEEAAEAVEEAAEGAAEEAEETEQDKTLLEKVEEVAVEASNEIQAAF